VRQAVYFVHENRDRQPYTWLKYRGIDNQVSLPITLLRPLFHFRQRRLLLYLSVSYCRK